MASDTAGEHKLLSVMTSMGKERVIFINVALCSWSVADRLDEMNHALKNVGLVIKLCL